MPGRQGPEGNLSALHDRVRLSRVSHPGVVARPGTAARRGGRLHALGQGPPASRRIGSRAAGDPRPGDEPTVADPHGSRDGYLGQEGLLLDLRAGARRGVRAGPGRAGGGEQGRPRRPPPRPGGKKRRRGGIRASGAARRQEIPPSRAALASRKDKDHGTRRIRAWLQSHEGAVVLARARGRVDVYLGGTRGDETRADVCRRALAHEAEGRAGRPDSGAAGRVAARAERAPPAVSRRVGTREAPLAVPARAAGAERRFGAGGWSQAVGTVGGSETEGRGSPGFPPLRRVERDRLQTGSRAVE